MSTFTVETSTYRNGEKPVEIVYLKKANQERLCVFSVMPDGAVMSHNLKGWWGSSGESPYDLIPAPPPPRPWLCESDVDPAAEWVKLDDLDWPRRITGVRATGLYLVTNFHSWETLKAHAARWSTTRTGEYVACVTVANNP